MNHKTLLLRTTKRLFWLHLDYQSHYASKYKNWK